MSSMNYQKVYMNQIHSSSLLCQLSHMWKSQMLCDAIIKTGQIITKAHRVVLVAACPMLQSMENASAGSHLEVRLAADIKQDSVNTFLQYLYEGFMMLTEENVRDVEKVARLLQVDSVIKCCADFYKCMNAKTGAPFPGSAYKYSFSGHDLAEFRHVRATGLQKTASERVIKRVSDFPRPGSPGSKRPRLNRGGSPSDVTVIGVDKADDTASMSHSYMAGPPDPWDRVPKLGSGMSRHGATGRSNSQPGVIEIVEESIELVQTEPPEKDSGQSSSRSSQRSAAVSIAVTSQFNTEPDISVVNVFGNPDTQSSTPAAATNTITSSSSSRGSITVSPLTIFQDPHPPSSTEPSSTVDSSSGQDQRLSELQFSGFSQRPDTDGYSSAKQKSGESQLTSTPQQRPFPMSMSPINQPKPFAAGSAMQAGMTSPSSMSLPLGSPSSSKSVPKPRSAPASPAERARDNRRASEAAGVQSSTADMTPDLSIVKIEASNHETGGLDMHVDMPEEGVMRIHPGRMPDEQEETSDKEIEDWAREEMSNEGSNVSGDQNNSWYMGTFKEFDTTLTEVTNNTSVSVAIGEIEKATIQKSIKHSVHSAVQNLEQQGVEWDYNVSYREGINPEVNLRVTNMVMSQYSNMELAGVIKACKSYFITRKKKAKWIQTNRVEETRKKQRKRQRMTSNRVRRLAALSSMTGGISASDRTRLEEALSSTTYISSQESDSDPDTPSWALKSLVVRKLAWRSDFLNHWFTKLDTDHLKSDRCLSRREAEEESQRLPPKDGPDWAVRPSAPTKPKKV
ncbi:serine-rich adhesin for platelets-like isoform X6 [Argopecten irradians]|uniref:serine-rich adhesin for platelets-like isoform X6 n=1 Tax=Argopecten irradians TaxID=31199 RepID=UPI00371761ED